MPEPHVLVWTKQLGTTSTEGARGVAIDSNNNVYIIGYTNGNLGGINPAGTDTVMDDVFLAKYDYTGELLWIKQVGTSSHDSAFGVTIDSNNNVYITGGTNGNLGGTNSGESDAFLAKYNSNGALLWITQLGTSSYDDAFGVAIDSNNNVYITGSTYGNLDGNTNAGEFDAFLSKYDSIGRLVWTKQLGTSSNEICNNLAIDSSNYVYITGSTGGDLDGTNAGSSDAFLSKYDSTGALLWTKQLGSSGYDGAKGIAIDSNNNVYITGNTYGNLDGNTNAESGDVFLAKYDSLGELLWIKQLGSTGIDECKHVAIDSNDNVYITGRTYDSLDGNTNVGEYDVFLAKYDSTGALLWITQMGTSGSESADGVAIDSNNNVYITGYTDSNLGGTNAGHNDAFLAKYVEPAEPLGSEVITQIEAAVPNVNTTDEVIVVDVAVDILTTGSETEKSQKRTTFLAKLFDDNVGLADASGKITMTKDKLLGSSSVITRNTIVITKALNTEVPLDTSQLTSDEAIYVYMIIGDYSVFNTSAGKLKITKTSEVIYTIYENYVDSNSPVTKIMNIGESSRFGNFNYVVGGVSGQVSEPIEFSNGGTTVTFTGTGELVNATSDLSGATNVVIAEYNSIGSSAFYLASEISSVIIDDTVASIGSNAFTSNTNLATVTFTRESMLTYIGEHAFSYDSSLSSFYIPPLVNNIGEEAFLLTTGIEQITVDISNIYYSTDSSGILFDISKTTLIQYPLNNAITSYTIPSSVTTIKSKAFNGSKHLTNITIPNNVTNIGVDAFKNVINLEQLTVDIDNPNYVDTSGVLFNISKTTLIQYPVGNSQSSYEIVNTVTNINGNAFDGANNLKTIIFSDISQNAISIGSPNSFKNTGLNEVIFKSFSTLELFGITGITSNHFLSNNSYLTTFFGKDDVRIMLSSEEISRLQSEAQAEAQAAAEAALAAIIFTNDGKTATFIGTGDFTNVSQYLMGVENVIVEGSYTHIQAYAFQNTGLLSITINNTSIQTINEKAFMNCTALTNISVTAENQYYSTDSAGVLYNKDMSELWWYPEGNVRTLFTIPASVSSVSGLSSFKKSVYLRTISVDPANTFLSSDEFNVIFNKEKTVLFRYIYLPATEISSYEIPSSVITISHSAFEGASNLFTLTFAPSSNLINIMATAFRDIKHITSLSMPDSLEFIGERAFMNTPTLTNMSFGVNSQLTTIVSEAFRDCGVESIYFGANVLITSTSLNRSRIQEIIVNEGNPNYTTEENGKILYNKDKSELLFYSNNLNNTAFEIPNTVITIAGNVFSNNSILQTITFAQNSIITEIAQRQFSNMSSLTTIEFPPSITILRPSCLAENNNLNSVTFAVDSSLNTIYESILYRSDNVTSITIPTYVSYISPTAFSNSGITQVILNSSNIITSLGLRFTQQTISFFGKSNVTVNISNEILQSSLVVFNNNIKNSAATAVETWTDIGDVTGLTSSFSLNEVDPNILYSAEIRIPNIDYTLLDITQKETIIQRTKQLYADLLGVSISDIIVFLSAGSLVITVSIVNNTVSGTPLPICFPAGTLVMTNKGEIAIETLNPVIHKIRGKKIVAITQTTPTFKYIIRIEPNSIEKNIPSRRTEISRDHKVFYKGKMIRSEDLVGKCNGVYRIKYNRETLYNVLMENHDMMIINNLICETLHPDNIMAKICGGKYTSQEKRKLCEELTKILEDNDLIGCKKMYLSLK